MLVITGYLEITEKNQEYEEIDFNAVNYNLNQRPMGVKGYKGYKFASKELRDLLDKIGK